MTSFMKAKASGSDPGRLTRPRIRRSFAKTSLMLLKHNAVAGRSSLSHATEKVVLQVATINTANYHFGIIGLSGRLPSPNKGKKPLGSHQGGIQPVGKETRQSLTFLDYPKPRGKRTNSEVLNVQWTASRFVKKFGMAALVPIVRIGASQSIKRQCVVGVGDCLAPAFVAHTRAFPSLAYRERFTVFCFGL